MSLNCFQRFLLVVIAAGAVSLPAFADDSGGPYAGGFTQVSLEPSAPTPLKLAVNACAGLMNRKLGGSIYIKMDSNDQNWLDELELKPDKVVSADDFLKSCAAEFPSCARYSYKKQHELMPSILTAAAALDAVPLEEEMSVTCGNVAFDAIREFQDKNNPLLATRHVFEKFITKTTGLAMLNPGYEMAPADFSNPGLTRDMEPSLVDYVFSHKLFVLFLVNGCVDSNPEKKLLHEIVNSGQWPTPLGVYGYNNSWGKAGYIYEAQTRCLDSRNMGAIPSEASNLSFFSTRSPSIKSASELTHNKPEDIKYDPGATYVAFVVGDGDNINFIMNARKIWLRQRLADCEKSVNSCAPLTWSISPHLPRMAPDVLKWYYKAASRTGNDYFILPPSGHLYSYPTSLKDDEQKRFAEATEQDARVLGVSGVVHWDWFDSWKQAEKRFLPRYAKADGAIRGVFPVNVPYMFPTFTWWPPSKFFNVLAGKDGGKTVVFKPREWRGVNGKGERSGDVAFYLTPQDMAKELEGYPPGTVSWVYMTSDGGLSLQNSYMELVKLLPSRVKLVSADTAARLALESSGK